MTLFLSDDIFNLSVGPGQYHHAQFVVFCSVMSPVIAVAATFVGALSMKLYVTYYVKNTFQSIFSHS